MNLNKKIKHLSSNHSYKDIRAFQRKHGVIIPTDYAYLIMNYDGLEVFPLEGCSIYNIDNVRITTFSEIIPFQYLESELPLIRELEEDDNIDILGKYCPFAYTISKIILLIGNGRENSNEIFLWNYEFYDEPESPERLHKIADNFEDLINNKLIEK